MYRQLVYIIGLHAVQLTKYWMREFRGTTKYYHGTDITIGTFCNLSTEECKSQKCVTFI